MASTSVYGGSIAIVGGGISGLTLAISLMKRGFHVQVYEQASRFGEIGAGVAFHRAAEQAMKKCDPQIYEAYLRVATSNLNPAKKDVFFDYFDAHHPTQVTERDVLFSSEYNGGVKCVHRAHFLDELVKLVPEGTAHFKKHLDTIEGPGDDDKYILKFADGTTAAHDVVIGTDGIKSSVRAWLVGAEHPSAKPEYTHKYAYRGLIPMDVASRELGAEIAGNAKMYLGKDGHVLTLPIDKGAVMNVVAFHTDKGDWPDYKHLTRPSTKEQAYEDFKDFGPSVKKIIDLLEPKLDCWAIFDTGNNLIERYNRGRVLVLGDAGHATTPHHGSGAGVCIEDAALLSELLLDPRIVAAGSKGIENAFEAYSAERVGRCQRLVRSSRRMGELYEDNTELGRDYKTLEKELMWRHLYLWDGEIDDYIKQAKDHLTLMLSMDK